MAIYPYNRYPLNTEVPSPGYPLGSARNVISQGDGTGTPWEAAITNDLFGWQQKLLSEAGIVISGGGTPDSVGASDYYDAMRRTAGFPGLIVAMGLNADPSVHGVRILPLNGQGILRASYPELDTACYVGDTANSTAAAFFRASNASGTGRTPLGIYLILPDARGEVPRGLDSTGIIDPDGATRTIGSHQLDATQKHNHVIHDVDLDNYFDAADYGDGAGSTDVAISTGFSGASVQASAEYMGEDIPAGFIRLTGVGRVSEDETRARNFAVNWGVWY